MRFNYYRCTCEYVALTARCNPHCPDCGKDMILITDIGEIYDMNEYFRPILKDIIFGRKK